MNLVGWLAYKASLPKILCLYGSNPTLQRLSLNSLLKRLSPSDVVYLDLEENDEKQLWSNLFRYPTDPEFPILVVVRNAERVQDWNNLRNLHSSTIVNHVVFIFSEALAESHYAYEFMRRKAKYVDCSKVSDDELLVLMGQFGLSKRSSELLLDRSSGDLKTVLNVIEKTKFLGSSTPEVITALCQESALDSFSDYLIFGHKEAAISVASTLSYEESLREVQFLFSRMKMFEDINGASKFNNKFAPEIAREIGAKVFLVKKYSKVSKTYDSRKILSKRTLLVATDSALRDGGRLALLSLVAMW